MYKGFCINKSSISLALSKYLVNEDRKLEFRNMRYSLDTKQSDVTSRIAKILKGDANGIIDGEALQNACMPQQMTSMIFLYRILTQKRKQLKTLQPILRCAMG